MNMVGRYYVRLTGCNCQHEHTLVDPDFLETLDTIYEVPCTFSTRENALDNGRHFLEFQHRQGSNRFDGFEIVGVH
jgi:hypothetical protein